MERVCSGGQQRPTSRSSACRFCRVEDTAAPTVASTGKCGADAPGGRPPPPHRMPPPESCHEFSAQLEPSRQHATLVRGQRPSIAFAQAHHAAAPPPPTPAKRA